jgi:hypothetical protein
MVYKSVYPFLILSLGASVAIGLYILFRCAGPLSRAYVNRINGNNSAAPEAAPAATAVLPPDGGGSDVAPGGGGMLKLKLPKDTVDLFTGSDDVKRLLKIKKENPNFYNKALSSPPELKTGVTTRGNRRNYQDLNTKGLPEKTGGKTNKNRSKKTYKKMKKQRKLTKMKKQRNRKTQKRTSI